MKTMNKKLKRLIFSIMTPCSFLTAQEVTFGSGQDGLGGFTTNTLNNTATEESWSEEEQSIRYINDDVGEIDDGQDGSFGNAALLREFVLDRSNGRSYKIEGLVTLTDGYPDDNNRVGIYLFSDQADLTGVDGPSPAQDEPGALYLHYNTDIARNHLEIDEGLDAVNYATVVKEGGLSGDDLFGTDILFEAVIDFVDREGIAWIDVAISMTDAEDVVTSATASVLAESFTDDYFGFATRARCRGVTSLDRVEPWTMDYRSFSITDLADPVPVVLSFTRSTSDPGQLVLEWPSQEGKVYDLLGETDLSSPVPTWLVWDGNSGIVASGTGINSLSISPGLGEPTQFFALVERDQ